MSIVSAKNISFGYDNEYVIRNASFDINKGDYIGIIGGNGTGKSTLIKLILGELKPEIGEVTIFGEEAGHFKSKSRIAYIPQNAGQISKDFPATVEEIVSAALYSEIGRFKFINKEQKKRVSAALSLVGMEDKSKKLIGNLSGGQQQRAMIAAALVSEPEIIFLDEPSNGIDSETERLLYSLLARLNREKSLTVVMITHDITGIANEASRILLLSDSGITEIPPSDCNEECLHHHHHTQKRTNKEG